MLKDQDHLKVKIKCKEFDRFVYCKYFYDPCVMEQVQLRLKGILFVNTFKFQFSQNSIILNNNTIESGMYRT